MPPQGWLPAGKNGPAPEKLARYYEGLTAPINATAKVFVVDDDPSVQKSLTRLLKVSGYDPESFSSASEFFGRQPYTGPGCMIVDVRMPGMSGLDFQGALGSLGYSFPIIFLTGHADVPSTIRAFKAGAIDFLTKPFSNEQVLESVSVAVEGHRKRLAEAALKAELDGRFQTLSPREREVCLLVGQGLLNKQIGGELGTSERTIKVHRARVMMKMKVGSVAQLVHALRQLGFD